MAVLILTRFKPFMVDYKTWLFHSKEQLIIFTPLKYKKAYEEDGYNLVIGFEDFDNDNIIFFRANKYFHEIGFSTIIALDERDIIRAAILRQEYNIVGQKLESALAYRNKIIMKSLLQKQNIPVVPFAPVNCLFDIYKFIQTYNYPVVLKPISGMGGLNTYIIYSDNDLYSILQINTLKDYMIEKYMDCPMGTFDGIVINNKIIFSSSCLYFNPRINYNQPLALSILSPKDDLFYKLKTYGEQIISTLPSVETSVFHCEIFINNDTLLLCECASRSPGGKIDECIKQSYGINMNEYVCKSLFSLPTLNNFKFKTYTGSIMIPKQRGILKKIPTEYPFKWVTEIEYRYHCGDKIEPTKLNGDVLMTIVLKGNSVSEISARCTETIDFINKSITISPC